MGAKAARKIEVWKIPVINTATDCPNRTGDPNNNPIKCSVGRQIANVSKNKSGTLTADTTASVAEW